MTDFRQHKLQTKDNKHWTRYSWVYDRTNCIIGVVRIRNLPNRKPGRIGFPKNILGTFLEETGRVGVLVSCAKKPKSTGQTHRFTVKRPIRATYFGLYQAIVWLCTTAYNVCSFAWIKLCTAWQWLVWVANVAVILVLTIHSCVRQMFI